MDEILKNLPPKHIEYEGYLLPNFPPLVIDVKKRMEWIRDFESRDTDVILCSFPKSGFTSDEMLRSFTDEKSRKKEKLGTHWLNEMISMLLGGKADYEQSQSKMSNMMEAGPSELMDSMPSPRLLNTHLPFRHIPKKHVQNGYKIVHVLRNPKDCAVSGYNHARKDIFIKTDDIPEKWDEFFSAFCENRFNLYSGWWNYEKEWEQAKKEKQVTNVHTVFYEDLKMNAVPEIKKLADFLEKPYTDELLKEIAEKCSFDNMTKAANERSDSQDMKKISVDGTNFVYRKGQIGDWKNWFTVAQNEMFDAVMEREMKDSTLKFTYQN